eukprot:187887-Pleurochrysis_carterae.AAC.3
MKPQMHWDVGSVANRLQRVAAMLSDRLACVDVGKGEGEGHTHLHPWPPPSTSLLLPLAPNSIGRTRTRPTGLERMSFAEFYLKLRGASAYA